MSNKPQTTNHKYLPRLVTMKTALLLLGVLLFNGCGKEANNTKEIDKKIDTMSMAIARKHAMDALGGCEYFKSSIVLSSIGTLFKNSDATLPFNDPSIIECMQQAGFAGSLIFCSGAFADALQAGFNAGGVTFFGEERTNKSSAFVFFLVEGLKLIEDLEKHLKKGEHEACEAVIKSFKALDTHALYSFGRKSGEPLVATSGSAPLPDEHKAAIKSLGESAEEILKEYKKALGIDSAE